MSLRVVDESAQHRGHRGVQEHLRQQRQREGESGGGSEQQPPETHFKYVACDKILSCCVLPFPFASLASLPSVFVVSDRFEGVPTLQRHRMVNALLKEELAASVHALSLSTKTPKEVNDSST